MSSDPTDSEPQEPSYTGEPANSPAVASWEFAGWGSAERITDLGSGPIEVHNLGSGQEHKLGQLKATAICGNDITSSCLYVSALCALSAGKLAPVALAIVAAILYLFRRIYAEVGSALPLNGGAYNVLLNTTSKAKASLAACLTLLSYIATAVISANEAMHYAHNVVHGMNVFVATIVLLGLFALLNIIGITESAVVALGIFVIHILTLTLLCAVSGLSVMVTWRPSGPTGSPCPRAESATRCSSASPRRCWGSAASRARPTSSRSRSPACSPRPCATCGSRSPSSTR